MNPTETILTDLAGVLRQMVLLPGRAMSSLPEEHFFKGSRPVLFLKRYENASRMDHRSSESKLTLDEWMTANVAKAVTPSFRSAVIEIFASETELTWAQFKKLFLLEFSDSKKTGILTFCKEKGPKLPLVEYWEEFQEVAEGDPESESGKIAAFLEGLPIQNCIQLDRHMRAELSAEEIVDGKPSSLRHLEKVLKKYIKMGDIPEPKQIFGRQYSEDVTNQPRNPETSQDRTSRNEVDAITRMFEKLSVDMVKAVTDAVSKVEPQRSPYLRLDNSMTCLYCLKEGHIRSRCPDLSEEYRNGRLIWDQNRKRITYPNGVEVPLDRIRGQKAVVDEHYAERPTDANSVQLIDEEPEEEPIDVRTLDFSSEDESEEETDEETTRTLNFAADLVKVGRMEEAQKIYEQAYSTNPMDLGNLLSNPPTAPRKRARVGDSPPIELENPTRRRSEKADKRTKPKATTTKKVLRTPLGDPDEVADLIKNMLYDQSLSISVKQLLTCSPSVSKALAADLKQTRVEIPAVRKTSLDTCDIGPANFEPSESMETASIKLNCGGIDLKAEIDSGSSLCIIPHRIFQKMDTAIVRTQKKIRLADNSTTTVLGLCPAVTVSIGGLKAELPVFVIQDASYDFLLGYPALAYLRAEQTYLENGKSEFKFYCPKNGREFVVSSINKRNSNYSFVSTVNSIQVVIKTPDRVYKTKYKPRAVKIKPRAVDPQDGSKPDGWSGKRDPYCKEDIIL